MEVRKTRLDEIDEVMELYGRARAFMCENGNPTQWWDGYPPRELILSDIAKGDSYVVTDNGEIVAVYYFKEGEDDSYKVIEDGSWQNDEPYAVIHRIAVKYNGRGIAGFVYNHCFGLVPNIRIDTHKNNIPMQHSLRKFGFVYCGIIRIFTGDERIAFQKV